MADVASDPRGIDFVPIYLPPADSITSVSASSVPFFLVKSQNSLSNPRLTVSIEPIRVLLVGVWIGSLRGFRGLSVAVFSVVCCRLLGFGRCFLHRFSPVK